MIKHKLKNLAVYDMPVDGTGIKLKPKEIGEAILTPRLVYLIQNKVFEDLGEVSIMIPKTEQEVTIIEKEIESKSIVKKDLNKKKVIKFNKNKYSKHKFKKLKKEDD